MQKPVKFKAGLIGAGYISEYHVRALRRLPQVELVGLCDVDAGRAAAASQKFGTQAFRSLVELHQAGANVIHVLTPPHTHAAVTMHALELGCHVLVEKPLTTDVEDCGRMVRKAQELGLSVCVNHSLLFDPQICAALEIVRAGKIGKVVSVDILRSSVYPPYEGGPLPPQYRTAGYPFRDLGIHALYLFEAFLGPIQNVNANWTSLGGDPNLAFDEWRALVQCRDGLGQFQLSWNVKPLQHQIVVQGTKGVLRVDLFSMFHTTRRSTPAPKAAERVLNAVGESLQTLVQVPWNAAGFVLGRVRAYHGLQSLVEAFYKSLAEGQQSPVPAEQAIRVVDWTERIARQADEDHHQRVAQLAPLAHAEVLVTGASGSLGSAIVERLQSQGHRVRVMVRRLPKPVPAGVEVVLGDLGDPEAVNRAVRGVSLVVHCGAAMKGGAMEHQCGTIVGTRNVLHACSTHGIEKLVYISSMSVVDWAGARKNQIMDEQSALEPHAELRGWYTRAKLEAERIVGSYCRENNLPTVILRPGQIFGGKIPLLTAAVARKLGRRWLILGNGRIKLPLIYMDDVVDGVIAAAESALKSGEIIQLVADESLTQNEVLARAVGKDAKVIRLPRWLVFSLGKFSEMAFAMLRHQSPFSLYRLRSALARRTFSNSRAQELLGWRPRIGLRYVDKPQKIGEHLGDGNSSMPAAINHSSSNGNMNGRTPIDAPVVQTVSR